MKPVVTSEEEINDPQIKLNERPELESKSKDIPMDKSPDEGIIIILSQSSNCNIISDILMKKGLTSHPSYKESSLRLKIL